MIYDKYDEFGASNIKSTRSDFTDMVGEDGIKDIIRKVFIGGNVRDTTEFITQRRLLSSYAATYELFIKHLQGAVSKIPEFVETISTEFKNSKSIEEKTFTYGCLDSQKKALTTLLEIIFLNTKNHLFNLFKKSKRIFQTTSASCPVLWNWMGIKSL